MRKADDRKNHAHGLAVSIGIGVASGFLVILILFAIFAAVIASGKISDNSMTVMTVLFATLGALIGAVVAVKRFKGKIMTVSLCVGAVMLLVTLVGAAFSETGTVIGKMTPILAAAFLLGGIAGGLLNVKRKKHKRA